MSKSFFQPVYITEEEIEYSPSREDGYKENEEVLERMYGCELITDAANLLKLCVLVRI